MRIGNAGLAALLATLLTAGSVHGQLVLTSGQTWTYTFPTYASFPVIQDLPFTGCDWQTFSFSIQAGSFEQGSQLRYEILAGGWFETEPLSTCYWVNAVTGSVMTVVSAQTVSISHAGPAWIPSLPVQYAGGIRLTMLSGSATIGSVTLHARAGIPSSGGGRKDVERYLSFVPTNEPPVEVSRLNATQMRVSWPIAYATYVLESATNSMAAPCDWRRFTTPPSTNSVRAWQDVDITQGQRIFRIRRR